MTPAGIEADLALSIDPHFAKQLVAEAVDIERAFALRRWQNTELDGGRFAEVVARVLYAVDSANLSRTKGVDECLKYIDNNQVTHHFSDRQAAIHIARVLRAIYKLRSQRGAVHVSPTYTANEIDSRLILEAVRWVFADILRIFVTRDTEQVARTIASLSRFPRPLIRLFGEQALLQSTTFTVEEEILAHLLFADEGLSAGDLVDLIPKDSSGVRKALTRLASAKSRQVALRSGKYLITDLGITRIEDKIAAE